jgi:O-antigen/teichoic acid export membrane protein
MDQSTRLIVNTVSNYATLAVNALVGFLLAPYILSRIGQESYGIWALTGSLLAYSQILSLGLNSAVNRWVPMYLVEKDTEGINRVVNTTLYFYLVASGIVGVGVAVLAFGFPSWFDVAPALQSASRITVALVGAAFVIVVTLNVFAAVLSGIQRYDLMALSDIASDLGRCLGVVIVLSNGFGLVAVAAVIAATIAVRGSLKAVLAMRTCEELRIDLSLARWQTFREMIGYSINTVLYTCGQLIQRQAALILVGLLYDAAAVTLYAMPLVLVSLGGQLVTSGSAAMKPAATRLDTLDKREQVQKLYLLGTKYALLLALPLTAFFVAYADPILHVWLGESYMASSSILLAILASGAVVYLWHMPAFFIVVGMGKHRMFGLLTLLRAILSLLTAVILTGVFELGIVGVAIGFASCEAAVGLFLITPYCCRCVGITVRRELRSSFVPAALATLPFAVALGCAHRIYHFQPENVLEMLSLCGVLIVPLLAGWWFLGFTDEEKQRFARALPLGGRFTRR